MDIRKDARNFPGVFCLIFDETLPDNLSGINTEGVSLLNMIVQQCSKQIVCGSDRMEVTGKVKVQILHGNDLGHTAARSSSLYAKAGTERRLSQGNDCLLAEFAECLSETDTRGRLALSRRGRVDCSNQNQLTIRPVLHTVNEFVGNLSLILSVQFKIVLGHTDSFRDLDNRFHDRFLGNFNICFHNQYLSL